MTSSTMNLRASVGTEKKSVYLVNPAFDLAFVCGGLILALSAICIYRFGLDANSVQQTMPVMAIGIFGTYLLSGPHTGATLHRLYGEADNRQRFKFVSYILPPLLVAAFVAGLFVPSIAKIEAALYLLLVWHHYMAQSYGIAMMYCARAGMQLTVKEKSLPRAIMYLAVTVAVAQQFTAEWQRQSFLNISLDRMAFLPSQVVTTLQGILLLGIFAFLIKQFIRARNGRELMPLPAVVVLLTGALFLVVGRSLSDLFWLFVPNLFHATQYLAVVLAYQLKGAEKEKTTTLLKKIEHLGDRFGEYFLLGLAFFTALPLAISALGFPLYLCAALSFFGLSFHHFAADACIWKIKNKSVLSRLV